MGVLSSWKERAPITTTAYALLGLLALRPAWSTWSLTKQLRRNMRFFWPRAESRIFAQARRLEARGLAQTTNSYVGRRQRTTYSITPNGHAALREWLATPPRATTLECEALLRIMLADFADPSQVQVALAQVRADAQAILEVGRVVGPEYLRGDAPFQDQLHVRAHVLDFLSNHALMLLEWADRTEAITSQWATVSSEQRQATARRLIEACLARYPKPKG
jgi:PadR family transcriptional regulator, regulatory protein AphA